MSVRLRPNEGFRRMIEEVTVPSAVTELDLTGCALLYPQRLIPQISRYQGLRRLRCVASTVNVSDVLTLLLKQLPHLLKIEFSLVYEVNTEKALESVREVERRCDGSSQITNLRRMYVEVGDDRNFRLLFKLVRLCSNLKVLHIHFLRGKLQNALTECRAICEQSVHLETFTFTSEVPPCNQGKLKTLLEFTSCTSVCGNVIHRKLTDEWSCVRLYDLAADHSGLRALPFQLVVAADDSTDGLTQLRIQSATLRHVWTQVRQICLLLLPKEPSSTVFPTVGGAYRECLRQFLDTALKHVVELNISSFHFGPDLDLSDLLRDGSLQFLQSLSVSTCGFRRPLVTLYRLAQCCPDFKDLDVRFDVRFNENDSVVGCYGCEGLVALDSGEAIEMQNCSRAAFPNGLEKLTLKSVHHTAFSCLIDKCLPVATLRLLNCPTPSSLGYARLLPVIAQCTMPRCLVIQHKFLQFNEGSLLDKLCRVSSLEHLYLLSAAPLPDEDVVEPILAKDYGEPISDRDVVVSLLALSSWLPRLSFVHVHYRSVEAGGRNWRMTWMRRAADRPDGDYALSENGPCFQCCSTATYIGLAKPLNRDFESFF
ncbi:hypothetical protein HPB52_011165 [Rhipicephalus sanguineus]|uniref:Uncharacterized protein n=1 Tax=Rhipicephalus sanguineus TaxID=34632 RepID=A0A9D4PGK9_RHISA|nr:hypothetical protein HPB52_011165 [Rhipicephalus sanguineus]